MPGPARGRFQPIRFGAMSEFGSRNGVKQADVTLVTGATAVRCLLPRRVQPAARRAGARRRPAEYRRRGSSRSSATARLSLINRARAESASLPPQMIEARARRQATTSRTRRHVKAAADDRRDDHRSRRRVCPRPRSAERLRADRRAVSLRRARRPHVVESTRRISWR